MAFTLDFLRPGSLLEVTGVPGSRRRTTGYAAFSSSSLAGGIVVLKRPPWWTASKVLAALAMLMSAVFACGLGRLLRPVCAARPS